MRLLFDQNLSWRFAKSLQGAFPGSAHVRELGLDRASDREVWEHARKEGYAIVSKDSDFAQRALLHGPPPKCVWLRVGNCSTDQIEVLLHRHVAAILDFMAAPGESCLVLS